MNRFTEKNKVFDLVETNHHLLPVINRFGINLGNKDKSLATICEEKDINVDFVLLIINTFNDESYFPTKELKALSPLVIIDYLRKTHAHYKAYILPKLQSLLHQLIESDNTDSKQLRIIEQFYEKYKGEVLLHLKEEEQLVFPYIVSLVEGKSPKADYSIHSFEKEHTDVDIKLNDLKNLIIKYIEPVYDNNLCNDFLTTLYDFEKDLNNHARIEDAILIPLVLDIEKQSYEV
jgi:regulator of cell morphogenesis and NO signaling